MKTAILIAFLFGVPADAASYRPTPAQEEEIKNHVRQGRAAAKALNEAPDILAAKKLKRQLEAEMRLPVDSNGDATRAPTEAELQGLNGFWRRNRSRDYIGAAKTVNDTLRARDYNLNRAAELAGSYFRIRPSRAAGKIRFNADPPILGSSWEWGQMRFHDGSGPDVPKNADAWISSTSGIVNLLESAYSSPAMLAFNIAHEALHYQLALADKEYGMVQSEEEVWINSKALRHVSDFGLSTDEVRFIFRNTACQYVIAFVERRRINDGESPKPPHSGFGLGLNVEGMSETLRAADADLAAFDRAATEGISDEALEAIRSGARSEFVRDMTRSDLLEMAIAWRSARENDAAQPGREARLLREQQEEEARIRSRQIMEAAAACGFKVLPDGDFYSPGGSLRVYYRGEVDRARGALLLIDSCQREGRPEAGPCNDAIGVVTARWLEPKFKDSMMVWNTNWPAIDAASALGQCLYDLHQTWTPRGDFADLKSAIERNLARRLAARPKPPAPPREPREPRDPAPPPRGDRGCYWTNDGREICP